MRPEEVGHSVRQAWTVECLALELLGYLMPDLTKSRDHR